MPKFHNMHAEYEANTFGVEYRIGDYVMNKPNVGGYVLTSYWSVVCIVDRHGEVYLGDRWDYSPTTIKQVKRFIEEFTGDSYTAGEIRSEIDKQFAGEPTFIMKVDNFINKFNDYFKW